MASSTLANGTHAGSVLEHFTPTLLAPAKQADHFRYHWDGKTINFVQKIRGKRTMFALE